MDAGWRAKARVRGDASLLAPDSVCAVVVAYFPDADLERRLALVLPQVDALLVVDNTPEGGCSRRLAAIDARLQVIENGANLGVGAALNAGLEHALSRGCRWLLTLDQDTRVYPDMVETLRRAAAACSPPPAIVGGNYLDPRSGATEVPAAEEGVLERVTVITSGSLVDVATARAIGGFRADYFIDQLDHEFCLRARARGGRVAISRKPVMAHSVGGPAGAYVPLWGPFPNHGPLRKYYITRNSLVTIARYARQEPDWCARRLARLLLGLGLMAVLEERRLEKVRAFFAGAVDALRGRMGACPRADIRP